MRLLYFSTLTFLLISCKSTFTTSELKKNYQVRMETGQKIEVKDPETGERSLVSKGEIYETYKVYMSPNEVNNDFEVVAIYQHVFFWNIGRRKKWLESAMIKCAYLGGNGIIVQSPLTTCQIIKEKK